jgi:hypothetical protein
VSGQVETETRALGVPKPGRGRRVAVYILLVLAGLLLLLTSFAVWVDRVALNTDQFVATSSELIEDDAIRQAVATRAVDELYANVDVDELIERQLPKDVKSLAAPTAAGLRQVAPQILDRAFEQPALQRVWAATLRQSHEELVDVLEGGSTTVSTESGVVTLDFRPIVLETADRLGLRNEVDTRLPSDAGRIEVLRSDELDLAQDSFQLLKTLAWVLPLVMLAVFAIVIWLAGGRRRVTIRDIGIVILVVGALGLVAMNLTGNYVVESLTADAESQTAGGHAWEILTELLRSSFRWQIVLGILFLVAAWLAGPRRQAVAARQLISPLLRERLYPYAGLAVVALVLLVSGPVSDFARILFVLVFVALLAAGIEVLRSQTLREFPATGSTPTLEDVRQRITSWFEARRTAPLPPARGVEPGQPADIVAQLKTLADLHASGVLTDAEFAAAKSRVLAGG